jgi:ATP-dependent Clp protease ATP-binding subunit ClpA
MFEKFTEKAINVITEAQAQAKIMQNASVQPEHLLLAIVKQAKGISLKLFKNSKITVEDIKAEVENKLRFEKSPKKLKTVPFSDEFKKLLKNTLDLACKSGNNFILFEHLFISAISESSYNERILEHLKFDIVKSKEILFKLVQKKSEKLPHPEFDEIKESDSKDVTSASFFEDEESKLKIFEKALIKLADSKYEILGTEQIIAAILESETFETAQVLKENGINLEKFEQLLHQQPSRKSEYDENRVVFTPSAFMMMDLALQTAKEVGSPAIKPEHIILGLLKAKRGVAYDIFKSLKINDDDLAHQVLKPIERQMPQALTILRLAKKEARILGRNVVGTEMLLLGIISEGTGIGFKVLNNLEITLKDLRKTIEDLIGYGNEYYDKEVIFTKRAKRILEVAWQKAKKYKKSRILSEHLLYAITTEPKSIAMKTLEQLGVDAVEIKQGILKELEKNPEMEV